jgi:tetratricopeptide (TPR) repeat protein
VVKRAPFTPLSLFLGILLLLNAGCSTKNNTFISRSYHNLTTHYNIYWNGEEAFKEGYAQLSSTLKDDYNQILPIYQTARPEGVQGIASLMDRAIEKSNKAIAKHSLLYDFKEYNRWIDACYLLQGRAFYYKQDYANARRNFDYVVMRFNGEPSSYEAMIWQAKCAIQTDENEKAGSILAQLQNIASREPLPKSVIKEIPITYSWLYQRDGNDGLTVKYLIDALKINHNKSIRVRLYFVLGQYYLKNEEFKKATQAFQKVLQNNPTFEMGFQAQIFMARSFDPSLGNNKGLEKTLLKMLHEAKNKEYASQIYFALGSLSQKEHNDTLAISRYKLSVAEAKNNRLQKSYAALKLGEFLFNKQQYISSQVYYDTAVQFLPDDHPDYKLASQRAATLSKLTLEMITIKKEDSLQQIARMPLQERNEYISNLIEKTIKLEEKQREQKAKNELSGHINNGLQNQSTTTGFSGEWYFYNPSALSFGYTEFVKRWGRRQLEDNWRLSTKRMVTDFPNALPKDSVKAPKLAESIAPQSIDPHKKESYLTDLPLTADKLKLSNEKIINALYNSALLYREGLNDNAKAAATFEQLIQRFPEQPFGAIPYYQLYRIYSDLQNNSQAEKYKKLLIDHYPNSQYAHLLTDPDFLKTLKVTREKALTIYEETLDALKTGRYNLVQIYCKEALLNLPQDDQLRPRFEYAYALSLVKTTGVDSAKVALQLLITKYPTHPVANLALDVLKRMDELPSNPSTKKTDVQTESFKYDPLLPHRFVIIAETDKSNIATLQARMNDFIVKQYPSNNLALQITPFKSMSLFSISGFTDSAKAMRFYDNIVSEASIQTTIKEVKTIQFIITEKNLENLNRNQNLDDYLKFFKINYKR